MLKIYDGRTEFFQWDSNQKLIVEDKTITEVHFCNRSDDCSLVCEVYTENGLNLVNVPNILLQDSWTIKAYAYCNDCYTKQAAAFKVNARTKPTDYVYTETEVRNWAGMEEKLEEAVNQLEAQIEAELVEVNNKVEADLVELSSRVGEELVKIGEEVETVLADTETKVDAELTEAANKVDTELTEARQELAAEVEEFKETIDNELTAKSGLFANAVKGTKEGSIIAIATSDVAPTYRVLDTTTKIDTLQDGEPSLDTPCPIKTVGKATLTKGGKNLIKFPYKYASGWNFNGITFTVQDDRSVKVSGTCTGNSTFVFGDIEVKKGITYVVSAKCNRYDASNKTHMLWIDSSADVISGEDIYYIKNETTFTPIGDGIVTLKLTIYPNMTYSTLTYKPQIEVGTVATAYEEYQKPTQLTIDFGQDIYGGSFNWTTGKLYIDTYLINANGVTYDEWYNDKTGTLIFQGGWGDNKEFSTDNYPCYCWNISKSRFPEVNTSKIKEHRCSHFVNYRINNNDINVQYGGNVCGFNGYGGQDTYWNFFYFKVDKSYLTKNGYTGDWYGWIKFLKDKYAEGNPLQLAYKMLKPIEVQLTPQQIEALEGATTLSSDTGATAATYNRDTNKVIEEIYNAIISLGGNV